MLGYIPSPSSNGISLGPLRLHMYGFLIVAGVFAAVWLADRRWRAWGGEAGTFSAIAVWAVPGGLIGARIYHVATDYELYTHHLIGVFEIWNGGLGIWGGIAGGVLAGWLYIRRHGLDFLAILDAAAPALALAQAIGRWGNYFNQELFGRPSKLPWAVMIDPSNRPSAYSNFATFQPTFLYESLWDLAVVGLLLLTEKRLKLRLRKGFLFWVYVALYTFGRFFTEYLRIDFAHRFLGLRLNDWVSVIIFVTAAALVLVRGLRGRPDEPVAPGSVDGVDDPDLEPAIERAPLVVAVGTTRTGTTRIEPAPTAEAANVAPENPEKPETPERPERPEPAVVAEAEPVAVPNSAAASEPVAAAEPGAESEPDDAAAASARAPAAASARAPAGAEHAIAQTPPIPTTPAGASPEPVDDEAAPTPDEPAPAAEAVTAAEAIPADDAAPADEHIPPVEGCVP